MHPDATIAALRRELAEHPTHAVEIEEQIALTEVLPRPAVKPESPETVIDQSVGYVAALERELREVTGSDRATEIKNEIERVKSAKNTAPSEGETVEKTAPSEEEIEQRKQARTNKGVEQARNKPTPDAPAGAKE